MGGWCRCGGRFPFATCPLSCILYVHGEPATEADGREFIQSPPDLDADAALADEPEDR